MSDFEQVFELKDKDVLDVTIASKSICFVIHHKISAMVALIVLESIITTIDIYCYDNIDVTIRLIILFSKSVEININIYLCGNNARVILLGMYALSEQQNCVIKTQQIHCGKNCYSLLILQGLLSGRAQSRYEGTIRIEEHASETYALQNNKNILLSDTSAAISIPNIEVLNHDVQCYHGAAVGKFDKNQIQYMQSRRLTDETIQQLLIQTLFAEPLQGYDNKELILKNVYEKI